MKHDLIAVRSGMGTGKTHQVIDYLRKRLERNPITIVMVSTRCTLTSAWVGRFQSNGIEVVDYREDQGALQPIPGKVLLVQVDSLARV